MGRCAECRAPLCRDCRGTALRTFVLGRGCCRDCRARSRAENDLQDMPLDVRLGTWYGAGRVARRRVFFKQCGDCWRQQVVLLRCEECGLALCPDCRYDGYHLGYYHKVTACRFCLYEHGEDIPSRFPKGDPLVLLEAPQEATDA